MTGTIVNLLVLGGITLPSYMSCLFLVCYCGKNTFLTTFGCVVEEKEASVDEDISIRSRNYRGLGVMRATRVKP